MSNSSRGARLAALAAISPAGAVLGGLIDEHLRQGFTIWLGACRTAGYSFAAVISFTLQLLPNAVAGALLGALLVQLLAFSARHRGGSVDECLAAHAGCFIAMPVGIMLCAQALPVGLILLLEIALADFAALGMLALTKHASKTHRSSHP